MLQNNQQIRTGSIQLRKDNIMQWTISVHDEIKTPDMKEMIEGALKLSTEAIPLLLKHTTPHSLSFEAQQELLKTKKFCAIGVLALNPWTIEIWNLFISAHKPDVPVKIFLYEKETVNWLKNYAYSPAEKLTN